MTGYCLYHKRYLGKEEIKRKRCRYKNNIKGKDKCRYFIKMQKADNVTNIKTGSD